MLWLIISKNAILSNYGLCKYIDNVPIGLTQNGIK